MDELTQELLRKIRTRKFAINNMNQPASNDSVQSEDALMLEWQDNIESATRFHVLQYHRAIVSNRMVVGKLVIFCKKVIRKLIKIFLGWLIFPILEQQSFVNGKLINAISILQERIIIQEKQSQEQGKQIAEILNMLRNHMVDELAVNTINAVVMPTHESELLKQESELLKQELSNLSQSLRLLESRQKGYTEAINYIKQKLLLPENLSLLEYAKPIDYMHFENQFRGSRENVKIIQQAYIEYFKTNGGKDVLDIGCGRGEFLELLWDNKISSYGIDIYEPFVEYCVERGFRVINQDALEHLIEIENMSLGGIFMGQVVEHLDIDYLRAIMTIAYLKLQPGCYLIIETPNPESLFTFTEFNLDPGHVKPIHPYTLEYILKQIGFSSASVYNAPETLCPLQMKKLLLGTISDNSNLEEFNAGIELANNKLFGFRDYTMIARK